MSDETRLDGDASQAAGGPATTRRRSGRAAAGDRPAVPGRAPVPARRGRRGGRCSRSASSPSSWCRQSGSPSTRVMTPDRSCPTPAEHADWSVARRWDEALLDAIRRALPNPPVHARNLFHTSVAMWDAWAAYDPTANGYIVTREGAGRRRRGGARRGDQLRRVPRPVGPLHQGGRRRRVARRVRGRHGLAVLPADGQHDRGRHAGRGRQPHRRRGPRLRPRATARTRPNGYAAPDYTPVNDAARRRPSPGRR